MESWIALLHNLVNHGIVFCNPAPKFDDFELNLMLLNNKKRLSDQSNGDLERLTRFSLYKKSYK